MGRLVCFLFLPVLLPFSSEFIFPPSIQLSHEIVFAISPSIHGFASRHCSVPADVEIFRVFPDGVALDGLLNIIRSVSYRSPLWLAFGTLFFSTLPTTLLHETVFAISPSNHGRSPRQSS
ncbi:hypothetical protein EDD15DRAFT_1640602 [Pisolithus albus]|nr:hypothetical protein EDD15DRAFT_1640602 [Pisolithus albus]